MSDPFLPDDANHGPECPECGESLPYEPEPDEACPVCGERPARRGMQSSVVGSAHPPPTPTEPAPRMSGGRRAPLRPATKEV